MLKQRAFKIDDMNYKEEFNISTKTIYHTLNQFLVTTTKYDSASSKN